ncbi:MAG: GTP pyrophosphokinase family protein [Firmicutes bacterium]|nr:GTP pyrophosphokinase family protein [Bacillota bacterium]
MFERFLNKKLNQNRANSILPTILVRRTRPMIENFNKLMSYYKCAMMEVETKLNVLNEEFSLQYDRNPINGIQSRLKKLDSIVDKLERNDLPLTMESIEDNLNDIAGVRVICSFSEDVYTIADALLKQDDITLIRKKDYIANPKPNGYRSLHLIVTVPIFLANEKRIMKVEIQLRTIAMDSWAALEHQIRYKKDGDFTEAIGDELYHCAKISAELDSRMNSLRNAVQGKKDKSDEEKKQ